MGLSEESVAREPSPEDRAIRKEERQGRELETISEVNDQKALKQVLRAMRREKPHFYVVFKTWCEATVLRDEPNPRYAHGVYRGFYSDLGRRLGIKRHSVKYRLTKAAEWAYRWLEQHD